MVFKAVVIIVSRGMLELKFQCVLNVLKSYYMTTSICSSQETLFENTTFHILSYHKNTMKGIRWMIAIELKNCEQCFVTIGHEMMDTSWNVAPYNNLD